MARGTAVSRKRTQQRKGHVGAAATSQGGRKRPGAGFLCQKRVQPPWALQAPGRPQAGCLRTRTSLARPGSQHRLWGRRVSQPLAGLLGWGPALRLMTAAACRRRQRRQRSRWREPNSLPRDSGKGSLWHRNTCCFSSHVKKGWGGGRFPKHLKTVS